MKKKPGELLLLARNALERAGANPVMAEAAARHLLRAEEHGLPTHGMSRVPFYCDFLRKGRADGAARPKMLSDRAAVCLIDNMIVNGLEGGGDFPLFPREFLQSFRLEVLARPGGLHRFAQGR